MAMLEVKFAGHNQLKSWSRDVICFLSEKENSQIWVKKNPSPLTISVLIIIAVYLFICAQDI